MMPIDSSRAGCGSSYTGSRPSSQPSSTGPYSAPTPDCSGPPRARPRSCARPGQRRTAQDSRCPLSPTTVGSPRARWRLRPRRRLQPRPPADRSQQRLAGAGEQRTPPPHAASARRLRAPQGYPPTVLRGLPRPLRARAGSRACPRASALCWRPLLPRPLPRRPALLLQADRSCAEKEEEEEAAAAVAAGSAAAAASAALRFRAAWTEEENVATTVRQGTQAGSCRPLATSSSSGALPTRPSSPPRRVIGRTCPPAQSVGSPRRPRLLCQHRTRVPSRIRP
mmetsp:Transcript_26368/g.66930  ORF Transcript_26368/g.66930 Transcript_26368/m.66930 type:complete len:281 (+) Transcript_26368:252-1094(+)